MLVVVVGVVVVVVVVVAVAAELNGRIVAVSSCMVFGLVRE